MVMKVSDYIVNFLINKGITDVFGYPGGMVTHLMDSFSKNAEKIHAHVNYHEQAAAFCACGYAQACDKVGVAYATSGPGATNLITGICNAYFDSVPTLFITGQVNTFEAKGALGVRQRGFQETDIVSMVKSVTKYSTYISTIEDVKYELEKAWHLANEGRKGPALLDIPMNIQRSEFNPEDMRSYEYATNHSVEVNEQIERVWKLLKNATRPVLLIGSGIKLSHSEEKVKKIVQKLNVPVVSSMLAFDVFPDDYNNFYGFVGAYGSRTANFVLAKSDLVITLGARLDVRQVGAERKKFAAQAQLVRVDIDMGELSNRVHDNEIQIQCDVAEFLDRLLLLATNEHLDMNSWVSVCNSIRNKLSGIDVREPNSIVTEISNKFPENVTITTDVGQNQVWISQSYHIKKGQKVLFSGGHGAMGYSLPAAIGAYYGSKSPVICFNGDGGIQMNMQELQFIAREKLPITIVIMNNRSLGMIRHFQEMYFDSNYYQTMKQGGYTVPDFSKVSYAYQIKYTCIDSPEAMENYQYQADEPEILEIKLSDTTYVFPKLEFGKPNQDQEPLINRDLYAELMEL